MNLSKTVFILIAIIAASFAEAPVFYETDGIVVIDMESADPLPGGWKKHDSTTTISYINYWERPMQGEGCLQSISTSNSLLTFKFRISTPGKYCMRLRGLKPEDGDGQNDCFLRVVGQSGFWGQFNKCVVFTGPRCWVWNSVIETCHHCFNQMNAYNFSAGVHQLEIKGRSTGFFIDRVCLWKVDAYSYQKLMETNLDPLPQSPIDGQVSAAYSIKNPGARYLSPHEAAENTLFSLNGRRNSAPGKYGHCANSIVIIHSREGGKLAPVLQGR
jgi:hypothetical protein